ncbi:MAG: ABC transporter ATP-binding protein [Bacillota bacterium]|nr:ABC transporter ATP-binding protein [Bacillota bacterium]
MIRPILEANNLTWKIGKAQILDINDFKIHKNDHIALIGPNGSGKSSLLKMLAFLEKPSTGAVILNTDNNHQSIIEKRRQMAVVFQEPLLLNMSVSDNIAYGLKIRGIKHKSNDKVQYWLERLNIQHLRNRHPKYLSGGEAQRVSLARAMALEPKILFLDEPFSGLDAPTKAQLLEEMSQIIKETNITSVFITHDFSDIPFMANKVCVLVGGKVVQQGTMEEIFYKPATDDVAMLVGVDIKLRGLVKEIGEINTLLLESGQMLNFLNHSSNKIIQEQNIKVYLRAEDVVLGEGNHNNFEGKVEKISPYGLQYKLTLNCGFTISLIVNKHQLLSIKPEKGNVIKVHIPLDRVHI